MQKIDTAVVADTAFASLVPHDAEFSPEKQRLRSEVYALERYLAETQQHSQEWVRHTQFTCEQEARRLFEMQQANFELAAGSAMAEARDVLKLEQAQLQSKFDQQSFSQQEDHRNSLHVALHTLTHERAAASDAQRACLIAKENYCSELKQQHAMLSGAAADAITTNRNDLTKQATEALGQRDAMIVGSQSELDVLRQSEFKLRMDSEASSNQQTSSTVQA